MGRNSVLPEIDETGGVTGDNNNNNGTSTNNSDLGFYPVRDRFPLKRNSSHSRDRSRSGSGRPSSRIRPNHIGRSLNRKRLLSLFKLRGTCLFYLVIGFTVLAFIASSFVIQNSLTSVFWQGNVKDGSLRSGIRLGSALKFIPGNVARRVMEGDGLDRVRSEVRFGVRSPRLAIVLGNMKKDPRSLMLITLMKNLQTLGYVFKVYAVGDGEAHSMWEQLGGYITILGSNREGQIDWTIFEGVIADSLEAKEAISSLMQEPFGSVPLIWIINEDILARRLPVYEEMGQSQLVSDWKRAFSRANVIIFPDYSLPMLYSVLDGGNFLVIPDPTVDIWTAESYRISHTKHKLREEKGFNDDDLITLVVGSSIFYNELSWDYAVAMHTLGPLLMKYGRKKEGGGSFKFVFLCGNSSSGYNDAFKELASRIGLAEGAVRHFGLDGDVNGVVMMADILIYGYPQEEQSFPSLIARAMTFGIPVLLPDSPVMKKYIADGAYGNFFLRHDPDALLKTFSLLISGGSLSKFAQTIASSGQLLTKNIMASKCIMDYARLLENVLHFPSDAELPGPVNLLQQVAWEWNLFRKEIGQQDNNNQILDDADASNRNFGVVYGMEEKLIGASNSRNAIENDTLFRPGELPSKLDWDVLNEIEDTDEYERLETEELEERMERDAGDWDEIYRDARKSEKLRFEANERDEGELERTGEPVCIYETYSGAGAWQFLHHGSLYRGLSLSSRARRLSSDDVNAVDRLPLLNDTYYRDILCEIGGMFSIANKVDSIHMRPWIGFQSWRAAGRKASLTAKAEKALEEILQEETKGDIIYFWAPLNMDGVTGSRSTLTFWSMCDILNEGHCRNVFEDAFRHMYGLPSDGEALPPMPEDGHHWSALHSWVMPTPSFLEFVMFSRMFADSLDALHNHSSEATTCLLGTSKLESKQCYCRMLELLVNVWAYHSGRKMVYLDPRTGSLAEQHPVEQRKGFMWAKYFNFTLLKSMDEDLAEAADDSDYPRERWLWPLTGEVHWQGVYEKEREHKYRFKMDKKRKTKEKLYERQKHGYRQKSLGG